MDEKENKIALIVEGGGFKSSFTAGVLDIFIVNKFNPFDLYLGVSGGAMNLTSYISLQYKRNIKIILDISKNSNFISLVRFLKGGNYVELKYLLDVAEKKYPFNIKVANNNLSGKDCRFVVTNFETGNKEGLKPFLSESVLNSFEEVIEQRKANDEKVEFNFIGIESSEIVHKDLKSNPMEVTVRFISEMITCIKNSKDEVISGSLNQVQKITDIWTFAKKKNSKNPNWLLVATSD